MTYGAAQSREKDEGGKTTLAAANRGWPRVGRLRPLTHDQSHLNARVRLEIKLRLRSLTFQMKAAGQQIEPPCKRPFPRKQEGAIPILSALHQLP